MSVREGHVELRLPAQDLDRARRWYAEKLGLEPEEERPGGLRYVLSGSVFCLYASAGASDGSFTQAGFDPTDFDATVAELRSRGVAFEEYEGFDQQDGVANVEGNYPSRGTGERAVWFRDSEGNLIGLGQPV